MPGNSHCLEHVRMCACGYLHVAQVCLQSFRLARQDEEHDAPRTPGVDWFWCAHTARCCSLNLWRSLSAVCVKAAIFTPQTGTGAIKKKKGELPPPSICFICLERQEGGAYHVRASSDRFREGCQPKKRKQTPNAVRRSRLSRLPVCGRCFVSDEFARKGTLSVAVVFA